ncbi:MAG: hypothetical protein FWC00_00430 [Firmicutes bacterium]|nr:hypothetical protein [Bacillota bacterium]
MIKIIVLDGPRGVGKDALIRTILATCPKTKKIVNFCTRPMRPGEVEGVDYFFTDNETFFKKRESGEIIEQSEFHGTYRGMSKKVIDNIISQNNQIAIVTTDIYGIRVLRKIFKDLVVAFFITVDTEVLRQRLIAIGDKTVEERLLTYESRSKFKNESDHIIENNTTLEDTVCKIKDILEKQYGTKL